MRCFRNIQKLKPNQIFWVLFAKGVGGVAIGFLIAGYFSNVDWVTYGWVLLVISLIIGLPMMRKVLSK